MPIRTFAAALVLLLGPSAFPAGADPVEDPGARERTVSAQDDDALIRRLARTNLINAEAVVDGLALTSPIRDTGGFLTPNPYEPQYRESYVSLTTLRHPLPRNALNHEPDESRSTFLFYGQEPVPRWYSSLDSNTEVCAVRFADAGRVLPWRYRGPS